MCVIRQLESLVINGYLFSWVRQISLQICVSVSPPFQNLYMFFRINSQKKLLLMDWMTKTYFFSFTDNSMKTKTWALEFIQSLSLWCVGTGIDWIYWKRSENCFNRTTIIYGNGKYLCFAGLFGTFF